MMRMAMSAAATALLRALILRAGVQRDRILLSEWHSIDWQSLTFVGERHRCSLRIQGPDSHRIAARLISGLADAEFEIPGHIVADVAVVAGPTRQADGATMLSIEALTIADDLA